MSEDRRSAFSVLVGKTYEPVLILRPLYKFSKYYAFKAAVIIVSKPSASGRIPFTPGKDSPVRVNECVSENVRQGQ